MPPGSLAAAHGVSEGRLEAHANAQVEVEDQLVDLALVLIADHLALALRIDPKVGLTGSDLAIVDACADGRLDIVPMCSATFPLQLGMKSSPIPNCCAQPLAIGEQLAKIQAGCQWTLVTSDALYNQYLGRAAPVMSGQNSVGCSEYQR